MSTPSRSQIVDALLERHGRTYASEIGADLSKNTPSPLFRWLCGSILLSARISAGIAVKAARALTEEGWSTAQRMAESTWEARARTLNGSGYARYDERTSSMLGDTSAMLIEKYGGDLRKLREAADRGPRQGATVAQGVQRPWRCRRRHLLSRDTDGVAGALSVRRSSRARGG